MGRKNSKGHSHLTCGLTLEDEFTLTRIRSKAHALKSGPERDNFFWTTVFRLICRERAYKTVMKEVGVLIDTNMSIFDDEEPQTESV